MTRAHYARYLVQIGKVSNDGQAFKRYLGQGKSAFVKAEWADIPTAIETIHAAGGIAIIAHPLRYNMTGKWVRKLITDFKAWGGDGMEMADCGQTKISVKCLLVGQKNLICWDPLVQIFISLVAGLS